MARSAPATPACQKRVALANANWNARHESKVASIGVAQPPGEMAGDALANGCLQQGRFLPGATLFGDRAARAEAAAARRVERARRLALHRHVATRALDAGIGHRRGRDQ